jgi:hypothetical protein
MVTAETAPLVKYLKADLQRIANSANEELKNIRCAGLVDSTRQAEEARVINEARAFAARRVESTVRHLHNLTSKLPTEHRPVNGVDETEKTARFKIAPPRPEPEPTTEIPVVELPALAPASPATAEAWHEQPEEPVEPWEPFELPEAAEEETDRWEPVADTAAHALPELEPEPEPTEVPVVEAPAPASAATAEAWHEQPEEPFEPWEPFDLPEAAEETDRWEPVADAAAHALPEPESEAVEAEFVEHQPSAPKHAFDSDDTEVLEELATLLQEIAPLAQPPLEPPPPPVPPAIQQPQIDDTEVTQLLPVAAVPEPPQPQAPPAPAAPAEPAESERERLERVLKFVARQEPGLRWAVGVREDGSTLLVTDLAHGWIPPGLKLPADIQLLEPGRRSGTAATLLGRTTLLGTYAPGDPLGWATDYEVADTSSRPRELPAVDDLGWLLGEATHWRDGLPRMVNTLAKAGAAGTGVVDAEIDILRVYLDTSRYQILAQYPDVDAGLLLNCLLLAATEAIATKDLLSANYHFAWFQMLSSPPASGWKAGP